VWWWCVYHVVAHSVMDKDRQKSWRREAGNTTKTRRSDCLHTKRRKNRIDGDVPVCPVLALTLSSVRQWSAWCGWCLQARPGSLNLGE